jgi:hypothetical protein
MFDMLLFGGSLSLILAALFCRFLYMKSLTGVGAGGAVNASYWGSYQTGLPSSGQSISLPKTDGICPICISKQIGHSGCSEH